MDELIQRFSTLATPETMSKIMANAQRAMDHDMSTQTKNISMLPPDPRTANGDINDPARFLKFLKESMSRSPRFPPPDTVPCANVQVAKYEACDKSGTQACSGCRLVSYCSKECQKAHWKSHKGDCKNPLRSETWMPAWSREYRRPSFITNMTLEQEFLDKNSEEFSVGMHLWGNTPAIDVINLAQNEKTEMKDFSLAFIASGDLRHVLLTINGLPPTYSGKLTLLVNDFNPMIVCRNIILLLILGTIPDESIAADMALHFWYSAFMPMEYRLRLSAIITTFIDQTYRGEITIPLGPYSTLSCCLPEEATAIFLHFLSSELTVHDAQREYSRVRSTPSRGDYRDRMYARLNPSHRVAFQEYRRFGIILPFGAVNAHFNCPNSSLFSLDGIWLQTDYADPLEGWDVTAILKAGKAHGAQPEDIYGCLYFFLSEQLRAFAQRIRKFKISFSLFTSDARRLPEVIRKGLTSGYGVARSVRFDRIEVSNILDANYVGIQDVLLNWSPLLARTPTAVIMGCFMNWFTVQEDGRATNAGRIATRTILKCIMNKTLVNGRLPKSMGHPEDAAYLLTDDMDALYENSKPFSAYLKKQGLDEILRKAKLQPRKKHTIVPHRILAPLEGPANALPVFRDDESWYNHTKLTCSTWSERFVEFANL